MRTIMWSIGTGDFVDDVPPHHIMSVVLTRVRPGGIALLHDADGSSTGEHTATVKVLPNLIEEIRSRGYDFVPLEPYLPARAAD